MAAVVVGEMLPAGTNVPVPVRFLMAKSAAVRFEAPKSLMLSGSAHTTEAPVSQGKRVLKHIKRCRVQVADRAVCRTVSGNTLVCFS